MKLESVEKIPERMSRHHLQDIIKEFVESDSKNVMIVLNDREYKSPRVCYECMMVAVKRSGYKIRVCTREGKVYLTKDMKD